MAFIANENHAIVAWFKRALAINRNRRNQRQTQKVFYVMPPSDEGGGFLRSKKTEGEKTKDYPSVGCRRQLPGQGEPAKTYNPFMGGR